MCNDSTQAVWRHMSRLYMYIYIDPREVRYSGGVMCELPIPSECVSAVQMSEIMGELGDIGEYHLMLNVCYDAGYITNCQYIMTALSASHEKCGTDDLSTKTRYHVSGPARLCLWFKYNTYWYSYIYECIYDALWRGLMLVSKGVTLSLCHVFWNVFRIKRPHVLATFWTPNFVDLQKTS